MKLLYFVLLILLLAACNSAGDTVPTLTPTRVSTVSTCEEIVATALNQTDNVCDTTERNQACYGNGAIAAQLRQVNTVFEQPGQRIQLGMLESMQLAALDVDTGEWGVALLRVQANLPDTLPGQNVTLLIFGNTVFRTVDAVDNPQAFYFQSGIGNQLTCAAAPPDGLLVQTPEGVANIEFNLNNVQIQLGSTAFIESDPEKEMIINVLEGQAVVTANNATETVPAGSRTRIPMGSGQGALPGVPSAPEPYDATALQALPLRSLERNITVAPPVVDSSAFAPIGFQIQDSIGQAGEFDEFTFNTQAGQTVYFDGTADNTNLRWTLTAPDGTNIFQQQVVQFDYDTVTLEQAGEYTLTVSGQSDTTGEYEFRVWDVPPAQPKVIAIFRGDSEELISGTIETPGVTDIFTFEAEAGQQVYFDGEAGDTNIRWALTAPDGTELFESQVVQFDYDTFVLEQTGTYTLTVDGLTDTTGNYSFRLLDVPPVQTAMTSIVTDDSEGTTSGTIETPGVTDIFTFEAEAGQQVYFDGEAGDTNIRWALTAPDGTGLFESQVVQFDYDTFVLEQTGTYTLTIDGLNDITGVYEFRLLDVPVDEPIPLTIATRPDDMTSGAIETPGVVDVYTFTAQMGKSMIFDGEADNTNIRWTLTAPDGTKVVDTQVVQFDYDPFTLEQAGEYNLTIDGLNDAVGPYRFQIREE